MMKHMDEHGPQIKADTANGFRYDLDVSMIRDFLFASKRSGFICGLLLCVV